MTLDSHYLCGFVAAIFSLLKHASCPKSLFFHFVASAGPSSDLHRTVRSVFPSLRFKIYPFWEKLVCGLISVSVREALENPLNYARSYLADLLEPCIERVIYLDSDFIIVDDIRRLWEMCLLEAVVTSHRNTAMPTLVATSWSFGRAGMGSGFSTGGGGRRATLILG
uniref:Hexosyltransferase n=1 Tax=Elaeis guineensis var. tenera TaxID=51953 RepID=A0A6J0PL88_ELAGV|nr:probable galacturonosyltransferase-like 6 [Elaeis guineensis]